MLSSHLIHVLQLDNTKLRLIWCMLRKDDAIMHSCLYHLYLSDAQKGVYYTFILLI